MSTETATDIAALVGEMEAVPCEHSQHGRNHGFAGEPASHYIHTFCSCGLDEVFAGCSAVVKAITSNVPMICGCGVKAYARQFSKVLGPVTK